MIVIAIMVSLITMEYLLINMLLNINTSHPAINQTEALLAEILKNLWSDRGGCANRDISTEDREVSHTKHTPSKPVLIR
jgi:hypothetical protein